MQFHDANGVIPPDAAAYLLLDALAITLLLDTQNNFVHGESSTMEATGMIHVDPVLACTRSYLHLWKKNAPPPTLPPLLIMFRWVPPQNI